MAASHIIISTKTIIQLLQNNGTCQPSSVDLLINLLIETLPCNPKGIKNLLPGLPLKILKEVLAKIIVAIIFNIALA